MSKQAAIAVAFVVVLLVIAAWIALSLYSHIPKSPELALKDFYEREVGEDQIMDPLILAGPDVVPLLTKELAKPDMPNRRYAVAALGNLDSKAALPILEQLVGSASEADYIRCDALTAIAMIDQEEGLRVGNSAKETGPECLSEIADNLARDYAQWSKSNALRRTYFQALMGRHG
jgi:hypothetical protein